jgi:arylsulfatase A-like enzyme
MNILYIHTHDSGRYFEPYGYPVRTPALSELARESVTFSQCFSAAPTCSPSRAALLTGMAPHSCGMLGLAHRGFHLNNPSLHIASIMKSAGFETILCGIQHEAFRSAELAYDQVLSCSPLEMDSFQQIDSSFYDLENARRTAKYLKTATKPFFLSFGLFNTHREFPYSSLSDESGYVLPPLYNPNTLETRRDVLAFYKSIQIVDKSIGIVLDALHNSGHDNDTVVLFTTDHGIPFPRYKCTLYDGGIGVACLLKFPGNPKKGAVCDALISHLDILPTLLDINGIPLPSYLQGKSLLPLLRGETDRVHDNIFAEITYHAAYEPVRCIRSIRYKYIRRFQEDRLAPVPANIDDCPAKTLWIENGYLMQSLPREELYDLFWDPAERFNLVEDASKAEVLQGFRSNLFNWMQKTADPLLKGPVPLPHGAFANKQSSLSPSESDFEQG